ncbi:MAG: c-type cytochrome biogenesis protein CcmI [Gammaproteobacteria bacterium]|nr:c-type cytochrome biogenesis protein CcmI [Gammaproteobacteria bacterium]
MNIMFWVILILMLLVAIGILVYPLLRVRKNSSLAYKDSNLSINDEKIKELDLDLKEGRIDQVFYKAAREELDKELLLDIPAENQQTAALHYTGTAERRPALALMITVFVPMLALLLYLELGMHTVSDETFAADQTPVKKQLSVEEMAAKLEAHIEKNGGSAEEWIMFGRSHKHLGRSELAANAFAVALEQDSENAQLLLESAEVIALTNNRAFTPKAVQQVEKAYKLEPDNANVLWFAGVSAYQAGEYQTAIDRLLKLLPTAKEDDVMRSIIGVVAKSRDQLVAQGKEMPELEALLDIRVNAEPLQATGENAVSTSLTVMIDISKEAREKFNADDLVFVYAKAKQGPRMPLAAKRIKLADLPAKVILDDSMAMVDGMNISAFSQLVVSARVTKSGAAIAQSGDYLGSIDVETKSATAVLDIVIDTVVP